MKLSISLPDAQVAFLDRIVEQRGLASRSAAIQEGLDLLAEDAMAADYRAAFAEWDTSGEAAVWDTVVGDGIEAETPWW